MTYDQQTLRLMLADMERAPGPFRPTPFWRRALEPIVEDLRTRGFDDFRTHRSALAYYVPGYGDARYLRHRERIEAVLSRLPDARAESVRWRLDGRYRARQDARLVAATDPPGGLALGEVEESTVGGGERHVVRGRRYSRSMLNYLRALTLLESVADTDDLSACLEIGGGYGTLGEILLQARPDDGFYVDVDIPPVAAVATHYLRRVFGADAVLGYPETRDLPELDLDAIRTRYRAVVLCPWQLPAVTGSVDLFANLLSFQEMEPPVVRTYCELVEPLTTRHVVLRNSVTGKAPSVGGRLGVDEPVTTDFVVDALPAFRLRARDSFVHGEESPDGTFRSEVAVLSRRDGVASSDPERPARTRRPDGDTAVDRPPLRPA